VSGITHKGNAHDKLFMVFMMEDEEGVQAT